MKRIGLFLMAAMLVAFVSCEKEEENENIYENGTYKAETSEFSHGWKAFLEVEIADDDIVTANFDYFDAEGGLKSETTVENYPMNPHPTVWLPEYESRILDLDITTADADVDVYTGATGAWSNLNALLDAVLDAAKEGDHATQVVVME